MEPTTGDVILAHHALLLAIPAFVPALIIAAVVLTIAARDRRRDPDESVMEQPAGETTDDDRSDAA